MSALRRTTLATLAATAAIGLPAAMPAGAGAKVVTKTFSSGVLGLPLPDDAGVAVSRIAIKKPGRIQDVNAAVRLAHTFDDDLNFELRSPGGRYVELARNNGGEGDDYGAGAADCTGTLTLFDDQAPSSIAAGSAPFAGSFQPREPLAAFNGASLKGGWELIVDDVAPGDTGVLYCWQLRIAYKSHK